MLRVALVLALVLAPLALAYPQTPSRELAVRGPLVATTCSGAYDLTLSGYEYQGSWILRATVAPISILPTCALRSVIALTFFAVFDPTVGGCFPDSTGAHVLCLTSASKPPIAHVDATLMVAEANEMRGPVEGLITTTGP